MNASWRVVFLAYPCPTCGAKVGDPCRTKAGGRADPPHADRTRLAERCPRCGAITNPDDPGSLCAHCALIRSLEVERSTTWRRRDP